MKTSTHLPGFPAPILLIGKIFTLCKFADEIQLLFSAAKNAAAKIYNTRQLSGLPEPVQRYFQYALKNGAAYVSTARIRHEGEFRPAHDKPWARMQGEQYFNAEIPGFVWKGVTTIPADHEHAARQGDQLTVTLLNLCNTANGESKACKEAELVRWLSEAVWFPTSLLPGEHLEWQAIDSLNARLLFHFDNFKISFVVAFNAAGQILQMETESSSATALQTTCIVKPDAYREWNGTMVPTTLERLWRFGSGDVSYARINLTTLEYNIPSAF